MKKFILDEVVFILCLSYIILRADIPSFFTAKITNILLLKPRNVILKALLIFEHFPSFFEKNLIHSQSCTKNTLTVFVFYLF